MSRPRPRDETHHVRDPEHAPPASLALGGLALVPLVAAALVVWWLDAAAAVLVRDLALIWAGALLTFFAGVRRGVSFRTEGGATAGQIAAMLWLFAIGVAVLAVPAPVVASSLALVGFASLAGLDRRAAATGEMPRFFARFRPVQMLIPVAAMAALLAATLARPP